MARILIAIAIFVGVCVFAVFTIEELSQASTTHAPPTDFGASSATGSAPPQSGSPLSALTSTDPSKFIPILRDNPHPGEITPFLNTAPYGQMPYRQPAAGEVWEFCAYRVPDASLRELVAHYNAQAQRRGLQLQKQEPASANMPGGIVTSWSDGQRGLQVTAWPIPNSEPTAPPLKPVTPLQWVVKYSYPAPVRQP